MRDLARVECVLDKRDADKDEDEEVEDEEDDD